MALGGYAGVAVSLDYLVGATIAAVDTATTTTTRSMMAMVSDAAVIVFDPTQRRTIQRQRQ